MTKARTTAEQSAGPTKAEELTRLFKKARSPDAGERNEAFNELYRYVAGPMRNLITGCVKRNPGRPVSVSGVLHDAVASLFLDIPKLEVNDTSHFRALIVQAVYWKLAERRRANRRLFEAVTDAIPARSAAGEVMKALERFEEAVAALAEHERGAAAKAGTADGVSATPLSDVVKARHLAGQDARGTDSEPSAARPVGEPTFEAIGKLLGITPGTVNKRYWEALVWLNAHFPDVVPVLPKKKKSGPQKGAENGGGP